MDNTTMQLGLLLETAKVQQQLVEALIEKLNAHTTQLAELAREEIRRTVREEFKGVADQTQQALAALQRLKAAANVRTAFWSFGAVAVAFLVCLAVALWVLPSRGARSPPFAPSGTRCKLPSRCSAITVGRRIFGAVATATCACGSTPNSGGWAAAGLFRDSWLLSS